MIALHDLIAIGFGLVIGALATVLANYREWPRPRDTWEQPPVSTSMTWVEDDKTYRLRIYRKHGFWHWMHEWDGSYYGKGWLPSHRLNGTDQVRGFALSRKTAIRRGRAAIPMVVSVNTEGD